MIYNIIDIDDEVWKVKEIKDGLPIFINEEGVECSPIFDSDYEMENAFYWMLLIETEIFEWMDRFVQRKKRLSLHFNINNKELNQNENGKIN